MFIGKTTIFILRENKSVKRIKLTAGKIDFTYKKGKYYLQDRGCFLKNKRVYAFYFEGIPNPVSFDNMVKEIAEKDIKNKDKQAELKIDSSVIKDMTEKDFLNALTEVSIEKIDILFLMLLVMSFGVSVITLYFMYQISQMIGLL